MKISMHVQQRYKERVNREYASVIREIDQMWKSGHDASDDEVDEYNIQRAKGVSYRVGCGKGGEEFLLVARDNCIVTVLMRRARVYRVGALKIKVTPRKR